jgi:hypothetical protein
MQGFARIKRDQSKTELINQMVGTTKLHYFLGRGRAETTRWMLAINQVEFEN